MQMLIRSPESICLNSGDDQRGRSHSLTSYNFNKKQFNFHRAGAASESSELIATMQAIGSALVVLQSAIGLDLIVHQNCCCH